MFKLFPFSLTAEESGRTVLHETGLAFAEAGDVGRDKVLSAHAFPWFPASGCGEGSLALNASGEGLLFGAHGRRWRPAGQGGRREIKELVGGHAELFAVGRALWGETRLELHGGRVWGGGGEGRCREGII